MIKIIKIIYSAANGDCQSFYLCIDGDKYPTQTCPAGLFFDPNTGRCDWMNNVDCPQIEIPIFEELPEEIELHDEMEEMEELHGEDHSHEIVIDDATIQEIANEVAADLSGNIANEVAGMIAAHLQEHELTHHALSEITSLDVTSSDMTSSDESLSCGGLHFFNFRM